MRSKIIQVAISPHTKYHQERIYAVCEDGSVWWRLGDEANWNQWFRLPDIPDDEDDVR